VQTKYTSDESKFAYHHSSGNAYRLRPISACFSWGSRKNKKARQFGYHCIRSASLLKGNIADKTYVGVSLGEDFVGVLREQVRPLLSWDRRINKTSVAEAVQVD